MRIIAGEWRGTNIHTPKGETTRPTLSRIREALFSMIANELPGARVLDVFAGSGSLGFEALSRGASMCDFVDTGRDVQECLRRNVEKLHCENRARIHLRDAASYLRSPAPSNVQWDIILCDPPYGSKSVSGALHSITESPGLNMETLVILQSARKDEVLLPSSTIEEIRRRDYGETALHFFRLRRP
jgi:16S rRNA (guanine966-N2)-methyltransferase